MIYIVDSTLYPYSHSYFMMHIAGEHTDEKINLFSLSVPITEENIWLTLDKVKKLVKPEDVVLLSWTISKNEKIDKQVCEIAHICDVVVAAGNYGVDIAEFTPAHLDCVITVGCLNKSGEIAACSNTSKDKELKWAPGTNYYLNGHHQHGTSVAAAVYAGMLQESKIRGNNLLLLDFFLHKYKEKVKGELASGN